MNKHQQHVRTASQGRKLLPPHARPTKPAPLKRGASYNNAHPQVSSPKSPSFNKTHWRRSVGGGEEAQPVEEEESGMASFLQFWYESLVEVLALHDSVLTLLQHDL